MNRLFARKDKDGGKNNVRASRSYSPSSAASSLPSVTVEATTDEKWATWLDSTKKQYQQYRDPPSTATTPHKNNNNNSSPTATSTTTNTKTNNISDSVRSQVARNTLRLRRSLHSLSQRGEEHTHRRLIDDDSGGNGGNDADSLLVSHRCPSISSSDAVNGDSIRPKSTTSTMLSSRNLLSACIGSGSHSIHPTTSASAHPATPMTSKIVTPIKDDIMKENNPNVQSQEHEIHFTTAADIMPSSHSSPQLFEQPPPQLSSNPNNNNNNTSTDCIVAEKTASSSGKKKPPKEERKSKKTKKCAQLKIPISSEFKESLLEVEFKRFPVNHHLTTSMATSSLLEDTNEKEKTTMVAQLKIMHVVDGITSGGTPAIATPAAATDPTITTAGSIISNTNNDTMMVMNSQDFPHVMLGGQQQQQLPLQHNPTTSVPTKGDSLFHRSTTNYQDRLDVEYVPMVLVRISGSSSSSKWHNQ